MPKANVTFGSKPYPSPKAGSVAKKSVDYKSDYVGVASANPLAGVGYDSRAQVTDNQKGKNNNGIKADAGVKVDAGRRDQKMGAGV